MAVPKFPKAATIRPIYTRGGTPIFEGFEPMGPGTPINTPFPTQIQNPNQIDQSAIQGGTRGAGPVRSGAFGYGVRRRAYGEYDTPITDPRIQEPGAPINQRPIVPVNPGRPGDGSGAQGNNGRGPSGGRPKDVSRAPASSGVGMAAANLRPALSGVGVQAMHVAPLKAAAASSPKAAAAATTTSTKSTKKAGKSGALLRR